MGIGIVLIFYLAALSAIATVSSIALVAAARWYLHNTSHGRTRMMVFAGAFPFLCVAYAGAWFVGYSIVNDSVFHHDPMLGDSWYTDIGNGYAIDMIDVTDHGIVHPADGPDRGLNSPKGIAGVHRMQVSGPYIFGSEDKNWDQNLGTERDSEDLFFVIDTKDRSTKEFTSQMQLAEYAKQNSVALSLRPIEDVYRDYRTSWFEPMAGLALVLPPCGIFVWLIVRLKREHTAAAEATT